MTLVRKPRPIKCKCGCGVKFIPARPFQPWATIECGVKIAMAKLEKKKAAAKREEVRKAKEDRKAIAARRLELRPMQYFLKRAERAVNALVRERDKDEPCISCGTWDSPEWQAGHFVPVGRAKSIRFDLDNISKQCLQCNLHFNGNATKYEVALLRKIGLINVERLKHAPKEKKWTREELQKIEGDAKSQLKQLQSKA